MKNIIIKLLFLLAIIITISSCSDDFEGITFELVQPNDLVFAPGDEVTFEIDLADDIGIVQLDIREPGIGLRIEEVYNPSISEIDYSFVVSIPDDQEIGSQIAIGLDITDTDNNILFEQIKLSIEL